MSGVEESEEGLVKKEEAKSVRGVFWKLRNKVFQEEGRDQLRERQLPAQEGKKARCR